jgi:hypothetical protein
MQAQGRSLRVTDSAAGPAHIRKNPHRISPGGGLITERYRRARLLTYVTARVRSPQSPLRSFAHRAQSRTVQVRMAVPPLAPPVPELCAAVTLPARPAV